MNSKIIPYGRQQITQGDIEAVVKTLQSDLLTQGPKLKLFEESFANYVGSKYAIAVANGTAALHLSALALGVGPGKKVITTPLTFAATANSVLYCGGTIEFCDINPKSLHLDIDIVIKKLETAPKGTYSGIIPVDFSGSPVNMEIFRSIANQYGLFILEDSCHAPGGYFIDSSGQKQYCGNGAYADLAIFSFHPVKHITSGEGGMITTNNKRHYEKLIRLRTHGITKNKSELINSEDGWYYEMKDLGFNYRLNEISCALGISQLKRANQSLAERKKIAQVYYEELKQVKEIEFYNQNSEGHAYHLFVIKAKRRGDLYKYLRDQKIYTQIHYIPLHYQPYYKKIGFQKGDFPVVENYYEDCISLPMYPTLSNSDLNYIIEKIKGFYNA